MKLRINMDPELVIIIGTLICILLCVAGLGVAYAEEPDYSVGLKMRQTMNSYETGSQEASRSLTADQVTKVLERADESRGKYSKALREERKCRCDEHPGY